MAISGKYRNINQTGGVSLLFVVIVVGAVGLSLATSLSLTNRSSVAASRAFENMHQARAFANACAEAALQEIRDDTSYAGSGALSFGGAGNCTFSVLDRGGEVRTVAAAGFSDDAVRRVRVEVAAVNPAITVESWEEAGEL